MPKKLALLAGCNYPTLTNHSLFGCVNDTTHWKEVLAKHYGFEPDDVTVLVDQLENGQVNLVQRYLATKANILKNL